MDQHASRKLIELLIQQLQLGDRRSIHLNAFPGVSPRKLDLKSLDQANPLFAGAFLEKLFTVAKFSEEITVDLEPRLLDEDEEEEEPGIEAETDAEKPKKSKKKVNAGKCVKRLNTIYYDSVDEKQEFGVDTFAFGYPLVVKRLKASSDKYIVSPLFLWYLNFDKSKTTVNKWTIRRGEDAPIVMNKVLMSFIEREEGIKLKPIGESYLEDGIVDQKEIGELVAQFLQQMQTTQAKEFDANIAEELEDMKEREEIETKCNENKGIYILNNGVFGCFRTMKESIIDDLKKLLSLESFISPEELEPDSYQTTSLSAVETDPSQQGLLNKLATQSKLLLEGPPGTGKSQTLTSIITNALANSVTCLVVCEKKTALEVIRKNLEKKGLGELVAVIDDVHKDRNQIVDSVRNRVDEGMASFTSFKNAEYKSLLTQFDTKIKAINEKHLTLEQPIHGDDKWTHTVGRFLKAKNKTEEEIRLESSITDHLKFGYEEYKDLISKIEKDRYLKAKLPDSEAFSSIADKSIAALSNIEFRKRVLSSLNTSIDLITKIGNSCVATSDSYENMVLDDCDSFFEATSKELDGLLTTLESYVSKYGKDFDSSDAFHQIKTNILGVLLKRYKQIKSYKETSLGSANSLIKKLADEYYDISLPQAQDFSSFSQVSVYLSEVKSKLSEWHKEIPEFARRAMLTLSTSSDIRFEEINKQTEEIFGLVKTLTEIMKSDSWPLSLSIDLDIDDLRIHDVPNLLSLLLDSLKKLDGGSDELLDYYDWRLYFLSLSTIEKSLSTTVSALKNPADWKHAFNAWYFGVLLERSHDTNLPTDDYDIRFLLNNEQELQSLQIDFIKNIWAIRQQSVARLHERKVGRIQTLYNKKGAAGNKRNSLRNIIAADFDLFSTFFPVVLVNPITCSSLMPLKEGLFDLVIFDEASQLKLADTFSALMRGKYKVVSGDSQQMPPSSYFMSSNMNDDDESDDVDDVLDEAEEEERMRKQADKDAALTLAESESLLEYASSQGYQKSYLDVHYRSKHPALINFSNSAFYGRRLLPFPSLKEYRPIEVMRVNGLYDDRTNPEEADKVIEILLTKLVKNSDDEYPSVGIATFNLNQRNLINDKIFSILNDETRKEDASLLNTLRSQAEPLFVKNLENIQGDERDVIIISTTFGEKKDGKFTQSYGPISQPKGHRLLNVIVTRAKEKLYVCTSIPEDRISEYKSLIDNHGVKSRGAFYSYLAYAKAISDGDTKMAEEVLESVQLAASKEKKDFIKIEAAAESPFEEEVVEELMREFGTDRVAMQYWCGGFRIDIVVKPLNEDKPWIAIECDGAKYHTAAEDYAWDVFRQKQLEKLGFKFHRIWSTNWFYDNKREIRKLAEFVRINE